jgi:hypothetical protein
VNPIFCFYSNDLSPALPLKGRVTIDHYDDSLFKNNRVNFTVIKVKCQHFVKNSPSPSRGGPGRGHIKMMETT